MSLITRGALPPALFLAVALFAPGTAFAATVFLVPSATPSAAMAEVLVRVRGELVSEGFTVEVPSLPPPEDLDQLLSRASADAVVALGGGDLPDSVEIRLLDPVNGKLVMRRMALPSATDVSAKTLAIQTLELIRATFLEMDLTPAPRLPEPPPAAVVAPATAPLPTERIGIDVGVATVFDIDASTPVVLPLVRLSWPLRPWLLPQLVAAGLGTRRTIGGEGISAEVSQEFALVGASCRFRARARLRPFLSLAAGVLHTSAQGKADPPDWARADQQWSLLLDASVGSWLTLGDRFQVALALQAQAAERYPAVRFSGSVVKRSMNPSILATITVGTWL